MSKKPPAELYSEYEIHQVEGDLTLTFDISSSCVGWAVGLGGLLVNYGKFVFKTTATLGEKIWAFSEFVDSLFATYKPVRVLLEEPLKRAKVRVHFEFLGVLRLHHMLYMGEDIPKAHFISPTLVKTHMHVQRGQSHTDNKQIMVEKVNQVFGLNLKFHPNSSIHSDDDVADAIAVLVTWWRLNGNSSS